MKKIQKKSIILLVLTILIGVVENGSKNLLKRRINDQISNNRHIRAIEKVGGPYKFKYYSKSGGDNFESQGTWRRNKSRRILEQSPQQYESTFTHPTVTLPSFSCINYDKMYQQKLTVEHTSPCTDTNTCYLHDKKYDAYFTFPKTAKWCDNEARCYNYNMKYQREVFRDTYNRACDNYWVCYPEVDGKAKRTISKIKNCGIQNNQKDGKEEQIQNQKQDGQNLEEEQSLKDDLQSPDIQENEIVVNNDGAGIPEEQIKVQFKDQNEQSRIEMDGSSGNTDIQKVPEIEPVAAQSMKEETAFQPQEEPSQQEMYQTPQSTLQYRNILQIISLSCPLICIFALCVYLMPKICKKFRELKMQRERPRGKAPQLEGTVQPSPIPLPELSASNASLGNLRQESFVSLDQSASKQALQPMEEEACRPPQSSLAPQCTIREPQLAPSEAEADKVNYMETKGEEESLEIDIEGIDVQKNKQNQI